MRLYGEELGLTGMHVRLECRPMDRDEEGWFHADWQPEYREGLLVCDLTAFLAEIERRRDEPDYAERTVRHELLHLLQARVWDTAAELLGGSIPALLESALEAEATALDSMPIWRFADPRRREEHRHGRSQRERPPAAGA